MADLPGPGLMEIIASRPPNFAAIVKVFPFAANYGVIFAYYPNIYVPSGRELPPQLIAHESVHIQRQKDMGVELWWDKYLADTAFRYNEELLAHQAEYKSLIENATCRQQRRSALKIVAKRLTSQLYGGLVSVKQAAIDIAGEAEVNVSV